MNQKMLDFHKSVESMLCDFAHNFHLFFGEEGVVVKSSSQLANYELRILCRGNDIKITKVTDNWYLLTEF